MATQPAVHRRSREISMSSDAFCSVISSDFLPTALALHASLAATNPGVDVVVFLVDDLPVKAPPDRPGLRFVHMKAQKEFRAQRPMWRYFTPFELCNALRPVAIEYLLGTCGYLKVIYLDTDIWVTGSFRPIWDGLDAHAFGFAPHITQPLPDDGRRPAELAFTQYGTFNSGFLAFRKDPVALAALAYWARCLSMFGFFEPPILHAGQEFLDLVAVNFRRGFWLIDHPGCNIAYWNLGERRLSKKGRRFLVNHQDAIFFHLSGYDLQEPTRMTRFPGRHDFKSQPLLRGVYDAYRAMVLGFAGGRAPKRTVFADSKAAKAKRRYTFLHGNLKGYSPKAAASLADPLVFNDVLLNVRRS